MSYTITVLRWVARTAVNIETFFIAAIALARHAVDLFNRKIQAVKTVHGKSNKLRSNCFDFICITRRAMHAASKSREATKISNSALHAARRYRNAETWSGPAFRLSRCSRLRGADPGEHDADQVSGPPYHPTATSDFAVAADQQDQFRRLVRHDRLAFELNLGPAC